MITVRFVVERTTVERCEIEVQANTFAGAASIAEMVPLGSSDWRRRRVRTVKSYEEDARRSLSHEVISGREVR
jgi:hypothetical protein